MTSPSEWPAIPYADWRDTCSALHLRTQIVGKYRLAQTPWINHSWHATLYATPRGLTTGAIPDPGGAVSLIFDFIDQQLVARAEGGAVETVPLQEMSIAEFFDRTKRAIKTVGGDPKFDGAPNEIVDGVPFADDVAERPYDGDAVRRFHHALLRVAEVLSEFRTSFLGKVSPVHLFWGSFDLAVTRFSGRRAPLHPGGVPALPDDVVREAYSHEVSSAGFWPGGAGANEAMFYSYAYPEPQGFKETTVTPAEARYDGALKEFLLPYEAVRRSAEPAATLLRFLNSTYDAAAGLAAWDRAALESPPGRRGEPRAVSAANPAQR